jgi:hypothetical protein
MSAAAFIPSDNTLKMSELTINSEVTSKVDALVRVDIYGFWYYTIFRRYNSPYDILVEDIHKNVILLEKSSTSVRQIMAQLLHLTSVEAAKIYVANNHSMAQACSSAEIAMIALDLTFAEIQTLYSGLYLNLEGVPPSSREETAAHTLLTLQIPKSDPDEFYQSPSDYNDLSMRVVDVTARAYNIVGEINELVEEINSLTPDYMLLRSGRRIYKL